MNSISIFGVFVADLCFFGNKIPTRGETVLGNNHLVGPGGKGSNQAIAAARLEGNVKFITKIGKDSHAEMALSLYKEAGVNTGSVIQDPSLSTGVAGIMIDEPLQTNWFFSLIILTEHFNLLNLKNFFSEITVTFSFGKTEIKKST